MADKERKKGVHDEGGPKLSHNPFASLKGRLDLPSAAQRPAPGAAPTEPVDGAPPKRPPGRLVQRRETKHRGGRAVIIVSGFAALAGFERAAVEQLAKELKHKLGSGGTVEEGSAGLEIVIQGDQAKKVAELLRAKGFRVDGVVT